MQRNLIGTLFATTLCFSSIGLVGAQEPTTPPSEPPAAQPTPASSPVAQATVESVMLQAVQNISRRYNLNEEQIKFTEELMRRDVTRFLKENEKEVWPIVRELLASQLRAPDDIETVKRIGASAEPLLNKIKDAVYKGNAEWRSVLTDDQRSMHDFDLGQMTRQFEDMQKNFKQWAEGKPSGDGIFPPLPYEDRSPPRPRKPAAGLPAGGTNSNLPEPERRVIDIGIFERFVENFIKEYELNPGQVDSARSILAEFKAKANDFRDSQKEQFARLEGDEKAAMEKGDRAAVAVANEARRKLLEPFYELFSQMEVRLRGLLTSAQLEKHGARKPSGEPKKPEVKPGKPAAEKPSEAPAKPADPVPPAGTAPATPPAPAPTENPPPSNPPAGEKPAEAPK